MFSAWHDINVRNGLILACKHGRISESIFISPTTSQFLFEFLIKIFLNFYFTAAKIQRRKDLNDE